MTLKTQLDSVALRFCSAIQAGDVGLGLGLD